MTSIAIHEIMKNPVLITRESARELASAISSAIERSEGSLQLNFGQIQGITPSFLDEMMAVVEDGFDRIDKEEFCVEIVSPPTRFSTKFAAIGRGRGLSISESGNGSWIIQKEREEAESHP